MYIYSYVDIFYISIIVFNGVGDQRNEVFDFIYFDRLWKGLYYILEDCF